jgi:3-oxoacyl-[acyl-carrier protein] reductase
MKNKVIIITGTRKGIGKQLAEFYLSQGHTVIGCSRNKAEISHTSYRHHELDVADEARVVKMVRETAKEFGRIDILLNNAGTAFMHHFILTPLVSARRIFDTNFFGTFLFCREVAKVMLKNKTGRIVNFISVATPLRIEGESIYAASKAAVLNFSETIAKELGPQGITVNCIGPTPVATDLIKAVPKHKIDRLVERQAIKRIGEFEDVRKAVDYFISDENSFITGQVLYLGGING